MANPSGRPRRGPEKTVRLEAYVLPGTQARIRARAAAERMSPGALLDSMFPPAGVKGVPAQPVSGSGARRHGWEPHQTFGKICRVCRQPERTAEATCPGQPEETY